MNPPLWRPPLPSPVGDSWAMTELPPPLTETPEIPERVLGKSQAAVEACCHGWRPGGGSSRRTINPIIAHLIIASLVCGSRS